MGGVDFTGIYMLCSFKYRVFLCACSEMCYSDFMLVSNV